ncbi:MAG: 50S ribosomal protein L32 [Actinobacteria bacterium]|nr:50S ribosomal protein L32 [Actinomycetota bacterium]
MAVPKRRKSGSKMRMRRSHWKAQAPTYSACPQCREPKLPHRVCPNCGYYAGRQVVETE